MTYPRYSVACENDDIQEFHRFAQAKAYAEKQAKLGRKDIVINTQDTDGDLVDTIKVTSEEVYFAEYRKEGGKLTYNQWATIIAEQAKNETPY